MYGPDNYIWGAVGYSGFNGEMNGKQMQFGQGVVPLQARRQRLRVRDRLDEQHLGPRLRETFDVFGSTANNDPSFYVAIPNRYFEGVEGLPMPPGGGRGVGAGYQSAAQFYNAHYVTPYIRQVDVFGGYTAGAGHQLYTARAFPKRYWNRIAFINEPTAHLVGQGIIEKQGAGFVTRDGWNLLAGAEEWVAPVHAQVGPDGAVWVADWYNFITQHNPTPPGLQQRRRQRLRDVAARPVARPHLPRRRTANAPPATKRSLSKDDRAGPGRGARRPTTCSGGCTRSGCSSSADRRTSCRSSSRSSEHVGRRARDRTAARCTRCGRCTGSASSTRRRASADAAAVAALKHPAAGVRKAAAMVLPKTAEARRARSPRAGLLAGSGPAHAARRDARASQMRRRHRSSARRSTRRARSRRTTATAG